MFIIRDIIKIVTNCWLYLKCCYKRYINGYQHITYDDIPLSIESIAYLIAAGRKTLVLDLDETLIHASFYKRIQTVGQHNKKHNAFYDFKIDIYIEEQTVHFYVYKRPHVDLFLNVISKWYNLIIYTASMENYATAILDVLDGGRGILNNRMYRQHCRGTGNNLTKDLTIITPDMRNILIIDNSYLAVRYCRQNVLPISSWYNDQTDDDLLKLLPFLDALRFTKDVRTILARRTNTPLSSLD